ncbi:MAG: LysM peptidoglycan-binding domain-containing protein [Opitutales bacterium]
MQRIYLSIGLCFLGVGLAGCETIQGNSSSQRAAPTDNRHADVAGMREDVRSLFQMVQEQNFAIEELNRKNVELNATLNRQERAQRESANRNYATVSQLNQHVTELNRKIQESGREQRREVIEQVTRQIEELARQTQRAMDELAESVSTSSAPAVPRPSFSEDYPREGTTYTVRSGDTLSGIARRFNSTVPDIQNANRIADAQRLQIGQELFIPQRD